MISISVGKFQVENAASGSDRSSVLIGTKGKILLADQRLKTLQKPIQSAPLRIWALVIGVGIDDEHGAGARLTLFEANFDCR
jgi:hypothetical protein